MRHTAVAALSTHAAASSAAGIGKYGGGNGIRSRARRRLTAWRSALLAVAVCAVIVLLVVLFGRSRVSTTFAAQPDLRSNGEAIRHHNDDANRSATGTRSPTVQSMFTTTTTTNGNTNNNSPLPSSRPDLRDIREIPLSEVPNVEQPVDASTAALSQATLFVTFPRLVDPMVHVWNWVSVADATAMHAVRVLTDRSNSPALSDSRRRYRLGGLALLLGRSQARQSKLLLRRADLCEAITPHSLEVPTHQDDVTFMAYCARQYMKRQHHCFQRHSTFLVASLPPVDASTPPRSLFEQLESVMALAYLGTSVSRTVVLPPARLPDGRIVPWAEIFDLRYFLAATVDDSLPTCFLESHEFEELEGSRLQMLRGVNGTPPTPTAAPGRSEESSVWEDVEDVSCNRAPHPFEVREDRMIPRISCTETHTALLPLELRSTNAVAVEAALDELLQEVGGSFHRIVHLGPNLLRVLSLVIPPLVNASGDIRMAQPATQSDSSAARRFLRCLWRTVAPHPFVLRAVRLLDGTLEDRVPSKVGLDRTLAERPSTAPRLPNGRDGVPNETPVAAAADDDSRPTLVIPSSERSDDILVHLQPLLEHGVVCLALTNKWVLVDPDDARRSRTCGLTPAHVAEVVKVASRGSNSVVFLHHPWNGDAEAQREASTLRERIARAQLLPATAQHAANNAPDELPSFPDLARPQPSNVVAVITASTMFRRNNRFTRFVGVVTNRRKLFLGNGNALLLRGLLPSPTRVHHPFALYNHFAAVPQLLEDSIAFWHIVLASRVVLTASYSSFERCVALRRWANRAEGSERLRD